MNINDCFPSRYIKAADLQDRPANVVMAEVVLEEVSENETKPVLYFEILNTGLLLNRTNANAIAAAYGLETDNWEGQRIQLYPAETTFRGSVVPCVRVRVPEEEEPTPTRRRKAAATKTRKPSTTTKQTSTTNGQSIHSQLQQNTSRKRGLR